MNIGDIVGFNGTGSGRYGVICEIRAYYHTYARRMEPLYIVKYIDPDNGLPMECPDTRCKNQCVICSRGAWIDEIRPFPEKDVEFYISQGMISADLVSGNVVRRSVLPESYTRFGREYEMSADLVSILVEAAREAKSAKEEELSYNNQVVKRKANQARSDFASLAAFFGFETRWEAPWPTMHRKNNPFKDIRPPVD